MNLDNISKIAVFGELREAQLKEIEAKISWNSFPKNLSILSHHDQSSDVYFIASGLVKATTFSMSGKEIAYQNLGGGEMFGEVSAFDRLDRTANVIVLEDSVVGKMKSNDFWWLIENYPCIVKTVLLRLTGIVRFLCGRIYEYGALNVTDRIRAEIIRNARQNLNENNTAKISDMPTHEEIANKISTHREAVTKEFSYLARHGYIKKVDGNLTVPDIDRLEYLVEDYISET